MQLPHDREKEKEIQEGPGGGWRITQHFENHEQKMRGKQNRREQKREEKSKEEKRRERQRREVREIER